MKNILITCLLLLSFTCSKAYAGEWNFNKWDTTTKAWEITYQFLNVVDIFTTEEILGRPGGKEYNPLLGEHPSDEKLLAFGALWAVSHYWVTGYLYDKNPLWQKLFRLVSITEKGGAVVWNLHLLQTEF